MSKERELLPCPFCGDVPRHECSKFGYWHIWCGGICQLNPEASAETLEEAAKQWNRRAPTITLASIQTGPILTTLEQRSLNDFK